MKIRAIAEVTYTCDIDKEDYDKAKEYAEKNKIYIEQAILELYEEGEIDIYKNDFTESDISTERIEVN